MENPLIITTPLGDLVDVQYIHPSCMIELRGKKLLVDLIELPVLDFDVILVMDWFVVNHATIDYYKKCIEFKLEEEIEIVFQGDRNEAFTNLISTIRVIKLLAKGCQGYFAHMKDTRVTSNKLQQIPV